MWPKHFLLMVWSQYHVWWTIPGVLSMFSVTRNEWKKNLPNKLKGVYVYLIYRGYQLYCIVTCFLGLKDLQNQNRCLLLIFVALRHLGKTGSSLMILFFSDNPSSSPSYLWKIISDELSTYRSITFVDVHDGSSVTFVDVRDGSSAAFWHDWLCLVLPRC